MKKQKAIHYDTAVNTIERKLCQTEKCKNLGYFTHTEWIVPNGDHSKLRVTVVYSCFDHVPRNEPAEYNYLGFTLEGEKIVIG